VAIRDGQPYNRNQYVAWHGASAVYHTNLPTVPMPNGKLPPGKRRIQITSANWQYEHAHAASRFNSSLVAQRRAAWDGIYDPHTNAMHYPKSTQPTHVKWEQIRDEEEETVDEKVPNGTSDEQHKAKKLFSKVPDVVNRNFMVTDTVFVSPSISGLGIPGMDGDTYDIGPNGLPEVTEEILEELPDECRDALLAAKQKEYEWKTTWSNETENGLRGNIKVAYLGWPQ